MKRILILAVTALITTVSALGQNDAITKYFDKYVDDERFTMVYVSPKVFELAARMEIESDDIDQEVIDIIKELKGLRVLSYEGEGGEAIAFYKEAKSMIDLSKYEELITARDGDENVHIMFQGSGDIVNELFMLIGGDDTFTMLSFVGNIDLKKVGKLANMMDIDGLEHLEKVDDH